MEKYDFSSLLALANATNSFKVSSGLDLLAFHLFLLTFGAFNICLIILLSWSFCWRRSYHPNFRILFLNFFLSLFLESFCLAGYSLSVFTVDVMKYPIIVWISQIGGIYGTNLLRITYFMFIVERGIATIKHASYEKNRNITVGIILVIISHLVDAFLAFNYFYLSFNMFAQIGILFTIDILTLFSLGFLIAKNRKLRRINGRSTIALSQRYQIYENIRALSISLPIISAGISVNILATIVTTIQSLNDVVQTSRTPFFYVIMTPYVTFVLFLIIKRDKIARSRLLNILKCGKNGMRYDSNSNTVVFNPATAVKNVLGENLLTTQSPEKHFTDLKHMWK